MMTCTGDMLYATAKQVVADRVSLPMSGLTS
jgi:hypothetical protein